LIHSSSKSTVKSYWIVGTTLLMNFKKTKMLWVTWGCPPLEIIVSMIVFITLA
jgi:hypothetical protein